MLRAYQDTTHKEARDLIIPGIHLYNTSAKNTINQATNIKI